LANGATVTRTIVVTAPATAGTITNTATVSGDQGDPNTANNTASATTTVNAMAADLSITKTAPATVTTGQQFTYTLQVSNAGPGTASNVSVTDTLPTGVTFVSASSGCTNSSGTVTCVVGSLKSGKSSTDTITVTAPATAGMITNTATVNPTDQNPQNNTSSVTTTVQGAQQSADLAITKTGPASVSTGQTFTYTLSVHNGGPNDATGVTVTDTLPAWVTFVSASTGCTNASGTVTCTVGNLANGGNATITIVVTAPSTTGTITNIATVSATS